MGRKIIALSAGASLVLPLIVSGRNGSVATEAQPHVPHEPAPTTLWVSAGVSPSGSNVTAPQITYIYQRYVWELPTSVSTFDGDANFVLDMGRAGVEVLLKGST